MVDVDEFLGIAVDEGKPGALDVHHDPVPLPEAVIFIPEIIGDAGDLSGNKELWMLKAVPIFSPEHIRSHQHLKISGRIIRLIRNDLRGILRKYIDDFNDPIRIAAGSGYEKISDYRAGSRNIFS